MSQGGAPIGNKNAAKAKAWADALRKALAQYEADGIPQGQALSKIAERVVIQALAGEKDAIQEIGNRLDGKAAQSVEMSGPDGGPVETITGVKLIPLV